MVDTINDVIKDLVKQAESVVVTVGTNVTNFVSVDNPIFTGFSSSNWMPTFGPLLTDTAADQLPSSLAAFRSEELKQSRLAQLPKFKLTGPDVFITNNVEYIVEINDQGTKTAQPRFVQRGMRAALKASASAIRASVTIS